MIRRFSSSNLSALLIAPEEGRGGGLVRPLSSGADEGADGGPDDNPGDCTESGGRGIGRIPEAGPLGRPKPPGGRCVPFGRLIL